MMGPLEFLVIGFPGNKFKGEILPELVTLRAKGIIRMIDVSLIRKDEEGNTVVLEFSDLKGEEAEAFGPFAGDLVNWFAQDDIEGVIAEMPNNCSAAMMLFEHAWAAKLRETILRADGQLILDGRVPPEAVEMAAALIELETPID